MYVNVKPPRNLRNFAKPFQPPPPPPRKLMELSQTPAKLMHIPRKTPAKPVETPTKLLQNLTKPTKSLQNLKLFY